MAELVPGRRSALLWLGLALVFAWGPAELWRFPQWTAAHGGGAFVLVFAGALLLISLPLFWAELSLGRRGGSDVVSILMGAATRDSRSTVWRWLGGLQLLALWLLVTVAVTTAGGQLQVAADSLQLLWGVADAGRVANEPAASSLIGLLCWMLIVLLLIAGLLALRLDRSLQAVGLTLAMPAGLLFLAALLLHAGRNDLPPAGSVWALEVDFAAVGGDGIWLAVTRALLVAAIGVGIHLSMREYLPRNTTLRWPASLLAMGICATVWSALHTGIVAAELSIGPAATERDARGSVIVLRALLGVASLLAAWFMLLPLVAWLRAQFSLQRGTAAMLMLLSVWMLSMVVWQGYGAWADVRWDNLDLHGVLARISGEYLVPLAGALLAAYAGSGYGSWRKGLRVSLPLALALTLGLWLS